MARAWSIMASPGCTCRILPAGRLLGPLVVAWLVACGATANPHGTLPRGGDGEAAGLPRPGRYECIFEFIRLDAEDDAGSLASRHVQETSDRFYGKHPVNHASEMCEITEAMNGAMHLVIPGRPRIPIEALAGSGGGFRLLWNEPAEFRRIDDTTFRGQVHSASGIETITLYYAETDDAR